MRTRSEDEVDRHTISAEIRDMLEDDPDFRLKTTNPLPKGIHPKYTDSEAELGQKPASRVGCVDGSEGFLQI